MSHLIHLSQIAPHATQLTVRCDRCDREGRLSIARLLRDHGADAPVRVAMLEMETGCDRQDATIYERCSAYAPELTEIMRRAND